MALLQKMKPNAFYLEIPVWRNGCWLVWPVNREQGEEWFNNTLQPEVYALIPSLETADACTYSGSPNVIFLTKWKSDPHWIGTLTHECVHVATHILEKCGVKEKESCDEALAYLIGYLVESFLIALKKKR